MNNKVFSEDEIYDLLNADHSAYLEGGNSTWSYYAREDYAEQFAKLGDKKSEFEHQLRIATKALFGKFEILDDIKETDFESGEKFDYERRRLQDEIVDAAYEFLGDYII